MKKETIHNFSIRELKLFVKNKKLDDWIFAFLDGPGKNKQMAKGLRLRKENGYHSWIGPLNFPLDKLIRCTGPEDYMEYIEKDTKWLGSSRAHCQFKTRNADLFKRWKSSARSTIA